MKYKTGYPAACEYLGRVRAANRHVEWLRDRKANLQMLLTDTSVHYTDMPHSDSPDLQKHQTIQAEIDEIERQITAAEASAAEIRLEVGRTVCRLSDPVVQKALILHYLDGKYWTDVAGVIRFSIAQTYRYRDAGLAELEKLLRAVA